MSRWAMIADLRRCVGCQTCTAACKHANATPPAVQWRKVLDIESGTFPHVARTFVPVGCQHCADPPCMHVCPSTATRQRADGIVTINYDICIGCAFCAVACPYQARFKVDKPVMAYGRGRGMKNEAQREMPERIGVAQKCTFCSDRVDFGLANGLTPGVAPEATPACINSCIADALHFGDADDPDSNVSTLLRENRTFRMHPEVGTDPGFHYIWAGGTDPEGSDPEPDFEPSDNPLRPIVGGVEPWRQRHWDWRAAGNFIGGGTGTGLMIAAALFAFGGTVPMAPMALLAAALVCAGLFLVLLETGRPLRAPLNVFFHPQMSWMTREGMAGAVLVPLALLAALTGYPALLGLAALAAAGFLYCQARILHQAKGIPVWRTDAIVPLITVSGLADGAGLYLALSALFVTEGALVPASVLVAVLVTARSWLWVNYRRELAGNAPTLALKALEEASPLMHWFGTVVPVLAVAVGYVIGEGADTYAFALGGSAALAAGWFMKWCIIIEASYNQGFAITRTPERGTGGGGPGVKPGWG